MKAQIEYLQREGIKKKDPILLSMSKKTFQANPQIKLKHLDLPEP